jgi:hypothetical protein
MNKPNSLRAALVAAVPSVAADPEKLTVFIDAGSLAITGATSLSHELRYTCNVLLLDFAGDVTDVFIAITEWARSSQPDLATNIDQRANGITFEADILNNMTVDLSLRLQLTESVVVSIDADGKRTATYINDADETWVAP